MKFLALIAITAVAAISMRTSEATDLDVDNWALAQKAEDATTDDKAADNTDDKSAESSDDEDSGKSDPDSESSDSDDDSSSDDESDDKKGDDKQEDKKQKREDRRKKRAAMSPEEIAKMKVNHVWKKCESDDANETLNWDEASACGAPERYEKHFVNAAGESIELDKAQVEAVFVSEIKERIAKRDERIKKREEKKKEREQKRKENQEKREEKKKAREQKKKERQERREKFQSMTPQEKGAARADQIWEGCESKDDENDTLNWEEAQACGAKGGFKRFFFDKEGTALELKKEDVAAHFTKVYERRAERKAKRADKK